MRRLRVFLLTAALRLSVGCATGQAGDLSSGLEELIAKIPEVSTGGRGISPAADELAKQLRGFGATAVPRLVGLLESDDEQVREFAGYVVRDLDGLNESNLDALIKARRRGDGWIPPAIARIGTPRAIAFLIDEMRRKPEQSSQLTWALTRAGEKAAPALAAIFREDSPVSQELSKAIADVFGGMGPSAKNAVAPLLEIAADKSRNTVNRLGAVDALGSIGAAAAEAVPRLRQLAKSEPANFSDAVRRAILGIGTPEAAEILVARLKSAPPEMAVATVLRDIAALRENGRGAGPQVVKALYRDPWEDRVGAALTLGYIGYAPASVELKQMLQSKEDWRLVYAATMSLGRLQDRSALPDLRRLAKDHWSPIVRNSALKAINAVEGSERHFSRWQPANFAFEYVEYQNLGFETSREQQEKIDKFRFRADPDELQPAEIKKTVYQIEIVGYGVDGRQTKKSETTPRCALRFGDGLLVGGDRGEWGGELAYRDEKGGTHVLVPENTHAIHRMPFGVVAAIGLAHLTMNSGYLYMVTPTPGKLPTAKPWKVLPGAPKKTGILENGDLFVSCHGGDILITPSGEFRRAE